MHPECTVQSREDFLDRRIPRLDSDGLRVAANLQLRAHGGRSNCQGGAK
jgi:hypothetical protein